MNWATSPKGTKSMFMISMRLFSTASDYVTETSLSLIRAVTFASLMNLERLSILYSARSQTRLELNHLAPILSGLKTGV